MQAKLPLFERLFSLTNDEQIERREYTNPNLIDRADLPQVRSTESVRWNERGIKRSRSSISVEPRRAVSEEGTFACSSFDSLIISFIVRVENDNNSNTQRVSSDIESTVLNDEPVKRPRKSSTTDLYFKSTEEEDSEGSGDSQSESESEDETETVDEEREIGTEGIKFKY